MSDELDLGSIVCSGPLFSVLLVLAVAWCSGLSAYGTVMTLGLMLRYLIGFRMPDGLAALRSGWIVWPAAAAFAAEFIVDKVPGWDSWWDRWNGYVRVVTGTILACLAGGVGGTAGYMAGAVLGFALSLGVHSIKAGVRPLAREAGIAPIVVPMASAAENCLMFAALLPLGSTPGLVILLLGFMLMGAALAGYLGWPGPLLILRSMAGRAVRQPARISSP